MQSEDDVGGLGALDVLGGSAPSAGYRLGYAEISTLKQDQALQLDACAAAGVERVFTDHASGALVERPQLTSVLEQLRPGTRSSLGASIGSGVPPRT